MGLSSNDFIEIEIFCQKTGLFEKKNFQSNKTVLENLIYLKKEINSSCGGMGTCGTCKILVDPGFKSDLSEQEVELFSDRGQNENERLACQINPNKTLKKIILPK